ncbi:MAG TPA: monovalent cation/H+ antiporter complex subunit F [Bacilli bacterium]|nr:monovalent cation/H+ antiporter complex subunit F [Bacilli bacterium]
MTFILISLIILGVAMLISFIRLLIGPTIWDRILMLNLVSIKVIMFVVLLAIYQNNLLLLDIALTYGIIGFLTMTLLSKFIMTGGREK